MRPIKWELKGVLFPGIPILFLSGEYHNKLSKELAKDSNKHEMKMENNLLVATIQKWYGAYSNE